MSQTLDHTRIPLNDTRASILTHLLSKDLNAVDLEEKLGINESAIRRHLDILEQKGYVEHYFKRASRGRPKKLYKITPAGKGVFPQKTHLLFTLLVRRIKKRYGREDLRGLLTEVAAEFADRLAPEEPFKEEEKRLKDFVSSLDKFGFYPSLSKREGVCYIRYRNCVFGDVIEEFHDELCDMHEQIVKKALPDCEVKREKGVEKGDNECIHRVILGTN